MSIRDAIGSAVRLRAATKYIPFVNHPMNIRRVAARQSMGIAIAMLMLQALFPIFFAILKLAQRANMSIGGGVLVVPVFFTFPLFISALGAIASAEDEEKQNMSFVAAHPIPK